MALFRCSLLVIKNNDHDSFNALYSDYNAIKPLVVNSIDLSRLRNYYQMFLLKSDQPEKAISIYTELYAKDDYKFNEFDFLWFLKSINDALLAKKQISIDKLSDAVKTVALQMDLNVKGHPVDLILREMALLEFFKGNQSLSLKYIRRSKTLFSLKDAEISLWLFEVINIHKDYIMGRIKNEDAYFTSIYDVPLVKSLRESDLNLSFLMRVRYYSPY